MMPQHGAQRKLGPLPSQKSEESMGIIHWKLSEESLVESAIEESEFA